MAPETPHCNSYGQHIDKSLSYMRSLTIRCVLPSLYKTSFTIIVLITAWVFPLCVRRQCHCRNFALVEEQHVVFRPGLNVITGESGAGKSVLVEAFSQVCLHAKPIWVFSPSHSISHGVLSCVMLQLDRRGYRTMSPLCHIFTKPPWQTCCIKDIRLFCIIRRGLEDHACRLPPPYLQVLTAYPLTLNRLA